MNQRVTFVASLFVMALVGFALGGLSVYDYLRVELNVESASARLRFEGDTEPVATFGTGSRQRFKYFLELETSAGETVYASRAVTARERDVLVAGGEIALLLLPDEPGRTVRLGEQSLGLPWWGLGIAALGVAVFGARLLREEDG